jgi:(4-(4-[2-(gamma-L-glutamylamino)ethyl]phenoxymethyl)furan-2-yl)methanamine synthase
MDHNSTGNVQHGNDLHQKPGNPGCPVTYSGSILGWDIGGVNTKVTRLRQPALDSGSLCLPYELQRDPSALGPTLQLAARQLGAGSQDLHAVTMTAELSQAFRSKGEGVGFILDALEATFPPDRLHVYTVAGKFVSPQDARRQPLDVAASNWSATAHWVATLAPTCVLIDIGTTTTDIIPILDGKVSAEGRTDPERLGTGELVYTGVLRTPVEAVTQQVPLRGRPTGLACEAFALMGDVFLWLGSLQSDNYTCPTPDGRPPTRRFAGERLARAVCADAEMLDDEDIDGIAAALGSAQLRRISGAIRCVRGRYPQIDTAIVTGLGAFLGLEAGRAAGLAANLLAEMVDVPPQTAPATAVAWLLHESLAATR